MAREKKDNGPVIVDGMIRYTSVSALQTFDPATYGGCPRRYYFKYVEKRKEPQTKAQTGGTEAHEQLEHYLTTGEDVLGPVTRAGKHLLPKPGSDLIVEQDFGDVARALQLREDFIKGKGNTLAVQAAAGLCVGDIPMVGYIDVRHARGEYVDGTGEIKKEQQTHVIELIDHKTTGDLKYVKSADELRDSIQMIGYANVKAVRENADFVRLSHITYQTRGAKAAKKTTTLISVKDAMTKWERVERLAPMMADVIKAKSADEVPIQPASCDAYRTGCPHKIYCNRPQRTVADLFQIKGASAMSTGLFDSLVKPAASASNGVPPSAGVGLFGPAPTAPMPPIVPPLTDVAREQAIAAEKARLLAEDAKPTAPTFAGVEGYMAGQGCNGRGYYASANGQGFVPVEADHVHTAKCNPPQHIGSINPPDSPPPDPIAAAAPLSPEVIAGIADPEIKARAEAHAKAHAAREIAIAAAPPLPGAKPPKAPKAGGRCDGGGQTLELSRDEAGKKKKKCPTCGKVLTIKPSQDFTTTEMPAHNKPKDEASAKVTDTAPKIMTSPADLAPLFEDIKEVVTGNVSVDVPPLPVSATIVAGLPIPLIDTSIPMYAVTQPNTEGITLYVDARVDKGTPAISLEDYWRAHVKTLEEHYKLADIRLAPQTHELGYSKWKAALSLLVKEQPPAPGVYVLNEVRESDYKPIIVEALTPLCSTVVRGR